MIPLLNKPIARFVFTLHWATSCDAAQSQSCAGKKINLGSTIKLSKNFLLSLKSNSRLAPAAFAVSPTRETSNPIGYPRPVNQWQRNFSQTISPRPNLRSQSPRTIAASQTTKATYAPRAQRVPVLEKHAEFATDSRKSQLAKAIPLAQTAISCTPRHPVQRMNLCPTRRSQHEPRHSCRRCVRTRLLGSND